MKALLKISAAATMAALIIFGTTVTTTAERDYDRCDELLGGGAMPCMVNDLIQHPLYSVDGKVFDCCLQVYLYDRLKEKGIEWWYEYALCQSYQESRYDIYAVNQTNFEDKGLFQYKQRYWAGVAAQYGREGADIFDPYAQIDVYTSQIAERINRGEDAYSAISDHYTGGSGYSSKYVSEVMQWMPKMERIYDND